MPEDPAEFRQRLEQRRESLLEVAECAAEAAKPVELDQARVGRLSRMDALQAQALAQNVQRRQQAELMRIEAALRRIDKDEYGYCLTCGEDIAVERLRVDPAATQCIRCAEREAT